MKKVTIFVFILWQTALSFQRDINRTDDEKPEVSKENIYTNQYSFNPT